MVKSQSAGDLQALYLDYVNNYISVLAFASAHGMTEAQAHNTIVCGRVVHETYAAWAKEFNNGGS